MSEPEEQLSEEAERLLALLEYFYEHDELWKPWDEVFGVFG